MLKVKEYEGFNFRRYSNPWIATCDASAKIDFSVKVGGYTGAYGKGEAGTLYISNPTEGSVYAYGQKDHRGSNTEIKYIKIVDGTIVETTKQEILGL